MIRILIVDDQKNAREYIKAILEKESNFEVVGLASDGYEGIELAKNLNPDIILMDIEMPRFNGLAASLIISQQNPNSTIIILSSHNLDSLLSKILNAGATGYLIKGAEPEKIVDTISLIYQGNKIIKQEENEFSKISKVNFNQTNSTNIINTNKEYRGVSSAERSGLTARDDSKIAYFSEVGQFQPDYFSLDQANKLNFKTLLSILKRRYPAALMGFGGVLIGAILYLIFAPKTYRSTSSIILKNQQGSISELGKDLSAVSSSREYSPLSTQAEIIESKSVISRAIKNISEENGDLPKSISPESVQSNLSIKVLPNTNILEISYVDSSPEFASRVLNEIIDVVIARDSNKIRSKAKSVRQFLENKVRQQQQELRQIETSENIYRKQEGIVSLDNQTANLVNSLSNLETQEQDLLTQIEEQKAKVDDFQQLANVDNAGSAFVTNKIDGDKQLDTLKDEITQTNSELAAARSNFTENNPVVINLLEKKAELSELYRQQLNNVLGDDSSLSSARFSSSQSSQTEVGEEIFGQLILVQNQLKANQNKLQAIQKERDKVKQRIASLPAVSQSLTELVRQRSQTDENLQFLQRKLEEARIAEAQLISSIDVTERGETASSPDSPRIPLVLATAFLMGTILAAAIVSLLEKTDHTLYDVQQAEYELQIPFLGSLPFLTNEVGNLTHIKSFLKNRDLYEPYRSFLKRLTSSSSRKIKTIVLSSTIAGEGKSVVASHLGAVSTMLSKRTLIIDAHMHQPEQSSIYEVEHKPGLSEVIEENWSLDRAIQATEIENLFILSSGVSASNSCTILESPSMQSLIREAEARYDLIIIDAPSTSVNYDANTLSQYSDGLIIVTRPSYTDKNVLKEVVEDLRLNKSPILGFVSNCVDNSRPRSVNSVDDNKDEDENLSLFLDRDKSKSHRQAEEVGKI